VINDILDDLVQISTPRWMEVIGAFNVRGGIHTTVSATYEAPKKKSKTKKEK
jgi:7-cyano-7-deazaguanine reductase